MISVKTQAFLERAYEKATYLLHYFAPGIWLTCFFLALNQHNPLNMIIFATCLIASVDTWNKKFG